MKNSVRERDGSVKSKHIVGLERHNLAELEDIESLVVAIGAEAFETDAQRLAALQTIDPSSPIQSIAGYYHPSLIGMSDGPFDVLSRVYSDLSSGSRCYSIA